MPELDADTNRLLRAACDNDDELASRLGGTFKVHKTRAQVLESRLRPGGPRVVLAKPMTYMNLSGESVQKALAFFKLTAADLIVVLRVQWHQELGLLILIGQLRHAAAIPPCDRIRSRTCLPRDRNRRAPGR